MFVRTQDPAVEPITVADVKAHSRIIDSSEDSFLSLLIAMAREYAEAITQRSLITQKWKLVADKFPGRQVSGTSLDQPFGYPSTFGYPTILQSHPVVLQKGPFQSVDSFTYLDTAGATQTLAPSAYVADLNGVMARLTPAYGTTWPLTLPQMAAVNVSYTTGYGDTADKVPAVIRHWMLVRVATMYENREEVAILARGKVDPLPYVDYMLDPYRIYTV
jgi:hypothetical protein